RLPPPHSLLLRRRILTNPQQPSLPPRQSFCNNRCKLKMAGFGSLAPKTKNFVVAGGLSAFVLGVYYYTMRAVGGTDELQVAIDKFEDMKKNDAGNSSTAGS
ncbi:Os05g0103800, partial [Oryza sativa Japonica Group]